ncbi:hypothetical protein GF356_02145 [candidate division GN15 bacterium]|nr:hypothetical protein [candidate division GN15 bacterium]
MRIPSLLVAALTVAVVFGVVGPVLGGHAPTPKDYEDKMESKRTAIPAYAVTAHRVGKMVLGITNNGTFGSEYSRAGNVDFFTGEEVISCEYPKGSNVGYLYAGAFWIGAVVGRDTLVSHGADGWAYQVNTREFHPDERPFGEPIFRSIIDPNAPEYEDAVSEEDFIVRYSDTLTEGMEPDYFGRKYIPLNIQVTEASYAWSYQYAEDIVLFDYQVKNIGTQTLSGVYMGVFIDADVSFEADDLAGAQDDLAGFLETYPATCGQCDYQDTVFLAWTADNDGNLDADNPAPHTTAARIVRTPQPELDVSFNWWVANPDPQKDFGPRERPFHGKWEEPYRDFKTGGSGTPEGDANKYYVLRNREFDYDQAFTASITSNDPLWLPPNPQTKDSLTNGLDTRFLLSFGPFDIRPGENLPLSFAYLAGEDLHTVPGNGDNLAEESYDPVAYYANLDFSDLGLNSRWASWIYDNPGVDTDNDRDSGVIYICVNDSAVVDSTEVFDPDLGEDVWVYQYKPTEADTCWIEGDGVPDFKGASPPPAPKVWVEPGVGKLHVRFNGVRSETTRDVFSREIDFEGYRVYLARDERATSYSVVASYDREDFNKWVFDDDPRVDDYVLLDPPFTLKQLRCLYGDSCDDLSFSPLQYTRSSPLRIGDSTFYFEKQDYNVSQLGVQTPIKKRFPNQPYPSSLVPDSARPEELTEDGYLKYFEYEFTIEGLLPTVPYWVNVTAFDYGSPQSGLPSLETSVTVNSNMAYPLGSTGTRALSNNEIYVYPNPYRIDAGYRGRGFEGRANEDRPDDRVRAIHFANVPPKCTIRIYTLDGDLVRELVHDQDPADPTSNHAQWNLITRNTQLVVSGLYYWTVESENGEVQIGKLMILM